VCPNQKNKKIKNKSSKSSHSSAHKQEKKSAQKKKVQNPISAPIFKFGLQFSDSTPSYGDFTDI
jgi:hypothetical protein